MNLRAGYEVFSRDRAPRGLRHTGGYGLAEMTALGGPEVLRAQLRAGVRLG